MPGICEPYIRRKAIRHLEKGRVVIFAAGTEIHSSQQILLLYCVLLKLDVIFLLKGTQVDGVYSADPKKDPNAVHFSNIDFKTVIQDDLRVMDLTAMTLSGDNNLPLIVFDIGQAGGFADVMQGKGKFTKVTN